MPILSLGFILKILLKFCKFQPRYSYKIYSYRKKECNRLPFYAAIHRVLECFMSILSLSDVS